MLLVEDDPEQARMLAELFTQEGYRVDVALDAQQGLHLALDRVHRILVVDRGLPAADGLELVGRLRRVGVTARILVLTALGGAPDRVAGLDAGADDYLAKPFDLDELLARVRALVRRHLDEAEVLAVGAGELDVARREVRLPGGRQVPLSGRECELLRLLASHPRTVHSRRDLRGRLFAGTSADSLVDTYVYHLRRKLGREVVRTVHGLGYRLGAL
ncbi:transcriptional regulator [Streptomyces sp. TS71-3]|nr:transcriptional regulator [Streptomyces sp. TS71-3]